MKDACHCKYAQEVAGWPEEKRNEAVRSCLSAGISIRQLARLTGISKGIIERIAKSN